MIPRARVLNLLKEKNNKSSGISVCECLVAIMGGSSSENARNMQSQKGHVPGDLASQGFVSFEDTEIKLMITKSENCRIPVEHSGPGCCLHVRAYNVRRNIASAMKALAQVERVLHRGSVSVGCKREEVECGEGTPTATVGVVVQPQLDGTKGALGLFSVLRIVNYNKMTRAASNGMSQIRWTVVVLIMVGQGRNELNSTARSIWRVIHLARPLKSQSITLKS